MSDIVWIVDDDRSIRWVLEKALTREGIPHVSFASANDAWAALEDATAPPATILSDIRMPGKNGLDFLSQLKKSYPKIPVIIMTAYADLDSAVSAFQGGAYEYLPKPFDVEQALALVRRTLSETSPRTEADPVMGSDNPPDMLGQAPAMQTVFRAIGRLAHSQASVLITGESGTGKELVARALHRHSSRAHKPFIALNTAAIPKDLLESELFGHERGAFTGATTQRSGRFEQAEGGTLFLDEIGDMPLELQTRLLRVLSDRHYYRVGGHTPLTAQVRIIAATHQHLEERVTEGLFREDLFHRLNVIHIQLPPLRERLEDIPLLTQHFLQKSGRNLDMEPKRLSEGTLKLMQSFDWKGNVRQLENTCHWLTIMAPGMVVETCDLPAEFHTTLTSSVISIQPTDWQTQLSHQITSRLAHHEEDLAQTMTDELERVLINETLTITQGRRKEAAQHLGWGRNTITRKIHSLGLDKKWTPHADD